MNTLWRVLICTYLGFAFYPLHAQAQFLNDKEKSVFDKKVQEALHLKYDLKPSIFVYALNFKIDILRDAKNKISVVGITANDSLAYDLFPAYKKLALLNFSHFAKGRKKFSVLVPILFQCRKQEDKAQISIDAALNAAQALYSPNRYDNRKEKETFFKHRIYKQPKTSVSDKDYPNLILLPLVEIEYLGFS